MFILFLYAMTSNALQVSELRSGDLLLQPIDCNICKVIQKEENSPYAHVGIFVPDAEGNPIVLEAVNDGVHATKLADFMSRTSKTIKVKVIRSKTALLCGNEQQCQKNLLSTFNTQFKGLAYNDDFLWDAHDLQGRPKLYCSQLVYQLLNPFLTSKFSTKKMHYKVSRKKWVEYFHHQPPDGLPGLSPGDIDRNPGFKSLGFL